jgi:formylglycine-generating enzyme required for sulfatase activity
MILIPAGEFIMGTNDSDVSWTGPEHRVYLDAYKIDKHEVTVEEYLQCVKAKKCSPIGSDIQYFKSKEPIREVSWFDADNYCKWAGKRLPTEAEWEKAARGPKGYVNPWGNREMKKGDAAIGGVGEFANVCSYKNDRSEYGVYDMAGNVEEWVADWFSDDYYKHSPYKNPKGPLKGEGRTVRGGSFLANIKGAEGISFFSTTRYGVPSNAGPGNLGFRCVRTVAPNNK